ncbi:MAG: phage holin family protein [Niabella sp.]
MFEIKEKVEDIAENIEEIAKTYYRLSVVRAADKGSKLGASLLITLLIFALLFFALLFACLGLSWWIGQKLGNQMLGFFIVSGGLFLILIFIVVLKKKVIQPVIRNIIINKIYG